MRDYKVQIVIPVYNAETTLKKCLDSLLNQTYIYWQAIIVDDKSKDGSLEVLREYAKSDPRFLVVASEVNQGSSLIILKYFFIGIFPHLKFLRIRYNIS